MAKVTFGPIVAEARNKVGGVVFSRNPYGAFSRAWFVPPYSNTAPQAGLRAAMTSLSRRWGSTLTDEQRAGWRDLGFRYKHVDVFKQKSASPGLQAFMKANMALYSVGYGPLDEPPLRQHASDPLGITVSATSGTTPAIQIDPINDPSIDEAVQIWVTPKLSPGRNYFFRHMRMVSTELAGTPGPWDASAGWSSRFGGLTYPSKLGVGVRYINTVTGAIGPWRTNLNTVTEGELDMLRAVDFNLTGADILALPSTPFTILPAPGAGVLATPLYAFLKNTKTATAYTNIGDRITMLVTTAGAQLLAAIFDDPVGGFNTCTLFLNTGTVNAAFLIQPPRGPFSTDQGQYCSLIFGGDPAAAANQPIQLSVLNYDSPSFNDLGDLTGGDPSNTITGTVYYVLQSV